MNNQPASLELDARVTYLPELVRESDPPGRACAGGHRRNRILFLSLIRKPRARARARTVTKNTPRMPTRLLFRLSINRVRRPSTMPSAYGCCVGAGEDTAAMRVVTVVGYGVSTGGSAAGGWDGEYVTRDKDPNRWLFGDMRAQAQTNNGE